MFDVPLTTVWHFFVIIAMLAYASWIIIKGNKYVSGQLKADKQVNPMTILKYVIFLLIGISIGWILMAAPKFDQRTATPIQDSQALPGGVTQKMVEEAEPPKVEDLATQRKALEATEEAAKRSKETERQKTFQQDRESYRKSMGLGESKEQ